MQPKLFLLLLFFTFKQGGTFSQTVLPATLNCTTTLTKTGSPYQANSNLVVKQGCELNVEAGVELRMALNTDLIVYGRAFFRGTSRLPISIHPVDSTWGSIFLDHAIDGTFNYVTIESSRPRPGINAAEPNDTNLHRAAVSSYYSSLKVNHCTFKNNLQCLYAKYGSVHINGCNLDSTNIREKINLAFVPGALVENCTLDKTYGYTLYDAIDFDAINNGIIRNNTILRAADDGIDIGEMEEKPSKDVLIINNFIQGSMDKGISIGENCKNIRVERNIIVGCAYGIAVKDSASALIDHNILYKDTIGIACYQKGTNWPGGGNAVIKNTIIANSIDSAFSGDSMSNFSISYSLSNTDVLAGNNNLNTEPLFISPETNDFHVTSNSPAINSGDPDSPKDPDGSITDIGILYGGTLAGLTNAEGSIKFEMGPNPSDGFLTVHSFNQTSTPLIMRLTDISGRLVYEYEEIATGDFRTTLNLTHLTKGLYFLQILSGNGIQSHKLVLK